MAAADLVVAVAAANPDILAVSAGDGRLTYADLVRVAEGRAEALRRAGVTDGGLVGVQLPPSAELVVSVLAVGLAGGVHVALDPAQPIRRAAGMLDSGDIAWLVTDPGRAAELGPGERIPLEALSPVGPGLCLRRTGAPQRPHPGLAYVVFTSGSTGAPKGVMVEQAGLVNLVGWHARAFAVVAGTRCSQVAAPGFDAFLWELWGCLCAGGTLCVLPRHLLSSGAGLQEWLLRERVEVGFVPTLLAEDLMGRQWPDQVPLRVLLTGGDRLGRRPAPTLPFALVNNYGVSEATVVSTSAPVDPGGEGVPSIGRPIDGVGCLVVDHDLRRVPAGDVGELVITGDCVARGYLGDRALSDQRFVEVSIDGVRRRAYRTGDLVSVLDDGQLRFHGRNDEQVQVAGHRVEPAEIQSVLDRHPAVDRSAVTARPDGRLAAFVVSSGDVPADDVELRRHLLDSLPPAMVPAEFRAVPALPVTANGKLDRAALLELLPERSARVTEDPLVSQVAAMVAATLGLEQPVSPDDNFLSLGGHSLLAAQLVTALSDEYGVDVSLHALFSDPTPDGLARHIRELLVEQVRGIDDVTAARLAAQEP